MRLFYSWTMALIGLFALLSAVAPVYGQSGAADGQWAHYAGDHGSSKYTPLDQIDRDNFQNLEVLWRWESVDKQLEDKTDFKPYMLRATPIVSGGVAYMATGLSQIAAINMDNGETLWVHDPKSYERGRVRG